MLQLLILLPLFPKCRIVAKWCIFTPSDTLFPFLIFFSVSNNLYFYYIYFFICVWVHMCQAHMWRAEDTFQESVPPFYHVGPEGGIQVVSLEVSTITWWTISVDFFFFFSISWRLLLANCWSLHLYLYIPCSPQINASNEAGDVAQLILSSTCLA